MVPFSELVAGHWYITIECPCSERLILFADLTQGKGTLQGSFVITCPACGTRGSYTAEHYYHEPAVIDSNAISNRAS